MADLSEIQASQSVKVAGAGPTSGIESNYLDVDANGFIGSRLYDASGSAINLGQATMTASLPVVISSNQSAIPVSQSGTWTVQPGNTQNTTPWLTQDAADGPVTPGTVATKSQLGAAQYNTTPPTLTNGQQASLQSTVDGKLKVDASFSVLGGQFVPTITNKLRVRYAVGNVNVPAAYTTIYTRSGTGLFFGFQTDFNSANVRLRLTIDGGQIFEITVATLKLFQFNDTSATRMQMGGWWTTIGNTVDFSMRFPIPYTSTILIEMQRSDGVDHTMSQYMVILTEDT